MSIWLRRLTAIVRSHTSKDRSVTAVSALRKSESVSAALLCSTSSRPKSDVAASTRGDRPGLRPRGRPGTPPRHRPASRISAATARRAASSMSTTSTAAPSRRQRTRRRPADTSPTAGDDGDLALETIHVVLRPNARRWRYAPRRQVEHRVAGRDPASVSAVQYGWPGAGKPSTVSCRTVAPPTKRYHAKSSPALRQRRANQASR